MRPFLVGIAVGWLTCFGFGLWTVKEHRGHALRLWAMVLFSLAVMLTLAACTHGGPVGSTVTCTDYPKHGPVGGCE